MIISALLLMVSVEKASAQEKSLGDVTLTNAEKEWMQEHPVIRLGADPTFAPFEFYDEDGHHHGMAADYVQIIRERTGLNLVAQPQIPWPKVVEGLQNKDYDLVAAVGLTQDRQAFLNFSESYSKFRRVILMRTDAPLIDNLDDLQGKIVGVHSQSSHHGFMRDTMPALPLAEFATFTEVLEALSNGSIDAAIGNGVVSVFHSRNMGLINIKVAAPASKTEYTLHFAGRKDWPELISIIDKGLATITRNEHNAIRKRWTISEIGTDYTLIWQIFAVLIPLVFLSLSWAVHARRQQKKLILAEEKQRHTAEEAMAANMAKSTFLTAMSHELRTPLNAIIGFSQLLEMDEEAPLSGDQKESVEFIRSNGQHLLTLINDILDLSTIEAGKIILSTEPVQLQDLLNEVASVTTTIAANENISVHVLSDLALTVNADYTKLKQVLINLINNAIKYNREGGSVSIDWQLLKQDIVRVSIIDTGVGISVSNQTKVFGAFNRLGQENSSIEGTGIGLVVTKNLVELMGGKIGFDSVEGEGSTFWFELPVAENNITPEINEPPSTPAEIDMPAIADISGDVEKHVLYIEDNPANRQLMQRIFDKQENYILHMVETGELGWEIASVREFDLVLMDINLPGIDGKTLTKKLRATDGYAKRPIVAVTAAAMAHDIKSAEGLFDDYLTKPIAVPQLLDVLKQYLA